MSELVAGAIENGWAFAGLVLTLAIGITTRVWAALAKERRTSAEKDEQIRRLTDTAITAQQQSMQLLWLLTGRHQGGGDGDA